MINPVVFTRVAILEEFVSLDYVTRYDRTSQYVEVRVLGGTERRNRSRDDTKHDDEKKLSNNWFAVTAFDMCELMKI